MISRIKQISQVGVFHDFTGGGSIGLCDNGNITVIFGRNRNGKTTLASIFQSIGDDNPLIVSSRTSIPRDTSIKNKVDLAFKNGASEESLVYSAAGWSNDSLKGKVIVFDQDFVHKNLMLGDEITRANKENLTEFILGEEDVNKTKTIGLRKKNLRESNARLSDKYPSKFPSDTDKGEVADFVRLKVDASNREQISDDLDSIDKRIKRLENRGTFNDLALPEINDLILPDAELHLILDSINTQLTRAYSDAKEGSRAAVDEHSKHYFKVKEADRWLREGYEGSRREGVCPFCSQDLKPVRALIEAYSEVFTEEYDKYVGEISASLSGSLQDINRLANKSALERRRQTASHLKKFADYVPTVSLEAIQLIEDLIDEETAAEAESYTAFAHIEDEVDKSIQKKMSKIGGKAASHTIDKGSMSKISSFSKKLKNIDKKLKALVNEVESVKTKTESLTLDSIETRLTQENAEKAKIENLINRIDHDDECTEYMKHIEALQKEKADIDNLVGAIEASQSQYLGEYFDRLNHWFGRFGSEGFTIDRIASNRGDKKVYSLSVKYKGEKASTGELHKIFSESDRRNLALSLFMARIEKINIKNDKVIVFDDPVVSFDDNRIDETCKVLKDISSNYSQLILLTHYTSVVKNLFNSRANATFIEVSTQGSTSVLVRMDAEPYASNPINRTHDEIQSFVDGGSTVSRDKLRVFMEEVLRMRFRKQIIENDLKNEQLGTLLSGLRDAGCYDNKIATELKNFKDQFNPDHHQLSGVENIEGTKNIAQNLLEVLYEKV